MIPPPQSLRQDLELRLKQSIDLFRSSRLNEPLERYATVFQWYRTALEEFLEQTVDLSLLREQAPALLQDRKTRELIRYLAGPLISEDDLNTLLDVRSITLKQLRTDPEFAAKVIDLVVDTLDQQRFPWVRSGYEPSESEKHAAVIASAALLANRKVATERRHEGKRDQEGKVAHTIIERGWKEVAPKPVLVPDDAPSPGEFCRETQVGSNKADLLVRLYDRRLVPIECKVSNSSLNSIKRLNEAGKKSTDWISDFGQTGIVPVAVLSGVFDIKHLEQAQARGLALFWAHDLEPLANWVTSATFLPGRTRR